METKNKYLTNHARGEDHYRRQKTHCPQGHQYSEENTWWYRGSRLCRICKRISRQTWRENVRASKIPPSEEEIIEKALKRFNTKYDVNEKGCWIWNAATDKDGYGKFTLSRPKRTEQAHRASWIFHLGPIPSGKCVLHHCDTPSCVNPNCLWLGTIQDNNEDRTRKGRSKNQYGKTHCKWGHEFNEENTIVKSNYRICKTCARNRNGLPFVRSVPTKVKPKPIPTWNGPPRTTSS